MVSNLGNKGGGRNSGPKECNARTDGSRPFLSYDLKYHRGEKDRSLQSPAHSVDDLAHNALKERIAARYLKKGLPKPL